MRWVAALVSGGLDSLVLVATLRARGWRVVPVYVRQGLRWEGAERYWLRRWLKSLRGVDPLVELNLPVRDLYGRHWSMGGYVPRAADPDEAVYLPGRNLLLIAEAGVLAAQRGIPAIALGTLRGNPFADATPQFRRQVGRVLQTALGKPLRVMAPLARFTKGQVIRRGRAMLLEQTFSCLQPRGQRHCGVCQKCGERRRGFRETGVPDKTRYVKVE